MIIVVAVLPDNEEGRAAQPLFQEIVEMAGGKLVSGKPVPAGGKGEKVRRTGCTEGESYAEKELGAALIEHCKTQKQIFSEDAKEIAESLQYAPSSGPAYLSKLAQEGALKRLSRGIYVLADRAKASEPFNPLTRNQ